MEKAVNLCDMGHRLLLADNLAAAVEPYERICVGSYFCDRYFLQTAPMVLDALRPLLKKTQKRISLVVPIPSQTNVAAVKKLVCKLLAKHKKYIDTLVVNDLAMLHWGWENAKLPLVLGRLLTKPLRDPRYGQTLESFVIPHQTEQLIQRYGCLGLEVEGCFAQVKKQTPQAPYRVFLHSSPYYMSCMRPCFFASIHKRTSKKFRQNGACAMECSATRLVNDLGDGVRIHRVGKGVFFEREAHCPMPEADVLLEMPLGLW